MLMQQWQWEGNKHYNNTANMYHASYILTAKAKMWRADLALQMLDIYFEASLPIVLVP